MDYILRPEVQDFVLKYIDDLLIVSPSFSEHINHLDILFSKLSNAKMTVNCDKSMFLEPQIKFLGFILSEKGIITKNNCVHFLEFVIFIGVLLISMVLK